MREVSQLKPALQQSILRFSGSKPIRILASSRRPLADAVRVGGMAEDFFYSIAGVTLNTVPLRHRRSETLAIAEQLLAKAASELGKPKPSLNEEFDTLLLNYAWPGNLAELDSAMKACVLIGDQEFALDSRLDLVPDHVDLPITGSDEELAREIRIAAAIQWYQQELISQVLHATGGNRKRAAKELKISYKALLYKLKKIEWDQTNGTTGTNGELS